MHLIKYGTSVDKELETFHGLILPSHPVHNCPYLIQLTAINIINKEKQFRRGVSITVYYNVGWSPIARTLELKPRSENWDLFMPPIMGYDFPIETIENYLKDIFYGHPIYTNASFEFLYDTYRDQIRREYMLEKGFTSENVPWKSFCDYYSFYPGDTKEQYKDRWLLTGSIDNQPVEPEHVGSGKPSPYSSDELPKI